MRFGDSGPDVTAVQLALIRHGFGLPLHGADGDFGHETRVALERFARRRRIPWSADADVSAALLAALEVTPTPTDSIPPSSDIVDLEGVTLYDLRAEQSDPHPKSRLAPHGKTVRRTPSTIDAIVLHQTAIRFGGGSGRTLARRSLGVACHAMAFHEGFVAWPVEPTWYIHHADRLNGRSLGLEVDGNFPGLVGGRVRVGRETPLSDALVHAARMGVKLLVEEGRRVGCPIRYIFAHRQTDAWRRADPGEALWRAVVLDYAVPVLHLIPRQHETFGHPKGHARNGMPVPLDWDPAGVGRY